MLPAEHPLAQQASLAPVDLAGEFFVTLELNQSSFANFLVQCCVQVGFSPLIRQQVIEVQTLLGLVRRGSGAAAGVAGAAGASGVVFRRLQPPLPEVPLYAIYRAGDDSAVLQRFLETLREQSAAERGMAQPLPA